MRRRTTAKRSAWWIEPGAETCAFCSGTYHAEVGYFCADCDRAICPVCIVTVLERATVHCPECPAASSRGRR